MNFFTADFCDEHPELVDVLSHDFKNYGGASKCRGEVVTIKLDKNNSELIKLLRDENGEGKVVVVDVTLRRLDSESCETAMELGCRFH